MRMRNRNIFITILMLVSSIGFSQIQTPLKWTFSSYKTSDSTAVLYFKATMDKGWHAYSQKNSNAEGTLPSTTFEFSKSNDYQRIGKVNEPKGIEKNEPLFDNAKLIYFENTVTFSQQIKIISAKAFTVKGSITAMTCNNGGCVPLDDNFSIAVEGYKKATKVKSTDTVANKTDVDTASKKTCCKADSSKADKKDNTSLTDANNLKKLGLWSLFLLALGLGFVALLTPCIYPMIPMTISYFMHGENSRKKSIFLAGIFGISIILIFILIGTIIAIIFGQEFANLISTHWLPNLIFFVIFIIFAASFFGMFELTLPSWMINKSDKQADKGGYMGAFFMALTLVLVSFSCTAPIVGSIMRLSMNGEVLSPIVGMFGYSLAFAIPFTLFAIFPSVLSNLPKSGGWLNSVKVVLGFIELAAALKFLSMADQTYHWRILDREIYLAIWIVIFTLMGIYLLGKIKFAHDSEVKFISVPRLIFAIITFSFVVYLIPGMFGAPLNVLSGWLPPMETQDFDIANIVRENSGSSDNTAKTINIAEAPRYADKGLKLPHGLKGYFDYDQALKAAKVLNKPVFVDFTGHACSNCRNMEATVWKAPEVLKMLQNDFVIVALYVDDHVIELSKEDAYINPDTKEPITLLGKKNFDIQVRKYGANAQPYYVLLSPDGEILAKPQPYNLDIDNFVRFLKNGLKEFSSKQSK